MSIPQPVVQEHRKQDGQFKQPHLDKIPTECYRLDSLKLPSYKMELNQIQMIELVKDQEIMLVSGFIISKLSSRFKRKKIQKRSPKPNEQKIKKIRTKFTQQIIVRCDYDIYINCHIYYKLKLRVIKQLFLYSILLTKNQRMSSSKTKQFKIDNILFNQYSIQSAIQQSDNKNNTLSNVFRFCQLKPLYQTDPLDKTTKNQMKDLINSKFQSSLSYNKQQQKIKSQLIDLSKVFPLNKPGNFGRTLQRKCKIVPKGVLQFQNQPSSQAKLKQVKSFINTIQLKSSSGNNSLSWHTQQKKYQYRIILVDNNGNNKAIYFQSKQEAQKARVYFCSIYKTKKISQKTIKSLQQKLKGQYWSSFNDYLIRLINQKKKKQQSILKSANFFQKIEKSQYNKSLKESNINIVSSNKSQLKRQYSAENVNYNTKMKETQKQPTFMMTQSIVKPATQFKKPYSNQPQYKSNFQFSSSQKQPMKNLQQSPGYLSTIQKNLQKKTEKRGYLDQLFKIHKKNQTSNSYKMGTQQSLKQLNERQISSNYSVTKETILLLQNINNSYIVNAFLLWKNKAYQHKKNVSINRNLFNTTRSPLLNPSNLKTSQLIQSQERLPQLTREMLTTKPNQKISKFQPFLSNSKLSNDMSINSGLNSISQSRFKQSTKKNNQKIQQSRFENRAKMSRKQQSIFPYEKSQQRQNQKKPPVQRWFQSIQFLSINSASSTDKNLFLKPIAKIKLIKKIQVKSKLNESKVKKQYTYELVQDYLFNTVLLKLHPHPQYQLVSSENNQILKLIQQNLESFFLQIEIVDFLTNNQLSMCQINLQSLQMNTSLTSLMDKQHKIRLYIKSNIDSSNFNKEKKPQKKWSGSNSMYLQLPPINKEIIIKIKAFWQKQAISKSYYNMQDNFSLSDAVSNSSQQAQPLSWWLNLTELEYTYLCILQSASKILNYRIIESMIYIIRSIIKINYKIQESVEILLSILMNFGKYYYFPDQIGQANYLHVQLGIKGNIGFENRVAAENILFKTIFKLQMPILFDKLLTSNVHLSHLLMQYTYQLFSRNFETDKLIQIWNFSHQNNEQVPLYLFLLTIGLCKFYEQKLIKCKRLKQVIAIFESKQIDSLHYIKKYVLDLKNKYFYDSKDFFDQIKQAFKEKPLERFSQFFYKKDQQQKQYIKQERITIKKQFCKSLINSNQTVFQLSQNLSHNNANRKYVLHIYFYKLPEQSGNLTMKEGNSQYECIGYQKNRYFIIGQVKSEILMKFVDLRGNQYKNILLLNLGVNQFNIKLKCQRLKKQIQVQYLCGLLTDSQIQIFKTNKKCIHFFGPYIENQSVNQQLLKSIPQVRFIFNQHNIKNQDSITNMKALFGFGQKQFNQIQFYLYKICCKSITLIEKIVQIQKLSQYASKGLYLCNNKAIFKMLIQKFLKINQFQIKETEFYGYFNDSLQSQFDAPKILKCRFEYQQKQLKLQKQLIKYQCQKGFKYLYEDIICDDILNFIKPLIIKQFGTLVPGDLKILYSTSGQIQMKNLKIIVKGKQLAINDNNNENSFERSITHDIAQKQPEILMTQVLPSFTKISTILDYVNTNKNVDLRLRSQDQQKKVIPQDINLLKYCQKKFNQCILLRYENYPTTQLYIPFLSYFYELTNEVKPLKYKFYYLNNVRDSIKSICTSNSHIKYSGSHKDQEQKDFIVKLGLYGNLRKYATQKSQTIYFWTYNKDENSVKDSLVNINYGYGIYRWQNCKIMQYRKKIKIRPGQNKNVGQSKPKIQYLIQHKDKSFFGRDYQVIISQKARKELILMDQNQNERIQMLEKTDIISGLRHLLGFMTNKN